MQRRLKILFCSAEVNGLVSTGGLADVAYALPIALAELGHDVRVAMPWYQQLRTKSQSSPVTPCSVAYNGTVRHGQLREGRLPGTRIPLYFVEHEDFFGRSEIYGIGATEYADNAARFCFFSLALLEGVKRIGWRPDIVHCHDWHTSVIPPYLKTVLLTDPFWCETRSVLTLHNLGYQGRYAGHYFSVTGLPQYLWDRGDLQYEGDLNLLKGGILYADRLNTVSPRYAKEIQTLEYGCGLDGVLRERASDLEGILNGVDYRQWNPTHDSFLPANYDGNSLEKKAVCKEALQQAFGLPVSNVPLFAMVSRLYWQKGVDLFVGAIRALLGRAFQVVILGEGDPRYEEAFFTLAAEAPDCVRYQKEYNPALSHLIQGGADFFVMPSRYEPCGLAQMYSLRYGTVPIVRKTGGLADTVIGYNGFTRRKGCATGIQFVPLTAGAVRRSIELALILYQDTEQYRKMQRNGMSQDFSWDVSARRYVDLYERAIVSRER
jgi:starch synthase